MQHRALIIGNSDGIGLAASKALLDKKWKVIGISRRPSPVNHPDYTHKVLNLNDDDYAEQLDSAVRSQEPLDVCIFCAGIGEMLDTKQMEKEIEIINVNFLGMVKTAATIIPAMVAQGKGHFIGLSSVADEMLSAEAPSYHASKAGFSNYLESLALALRPSGVSITNVRFGFVDTKMIRDFGFEKIIKDIMNPQDIADVALFLASEESKSVMGTDIEVYGKTERPGMGDVVG